MAAVLLTGNGVPWQLFNSVWGSLPFRFALPQQAALTILLLVVRGAQAGQLACARRERRCQR